MLYGIIAVFDQISFSNDAVLESEAACDAASRASSGQTVEYALTSRTLSLPAMICPRHFAERLVYG